MAEAQVTDGVEQEKRDITVSGIASWFFGIVFALMAFSYLMVLSVIPFGTSLVAATITLPPARRRVENAANVKLSRWVIVFGSVFLMIVAGASM